MVSSLARRMLLWTDGPVMARWTNVSIVKASVVHFSVDTRLTPPPPLPRYPGWSIKIGSHYDWIPSFFHWNSQGLLNSAHHFTIWLPFDCIKPRTLYSHLVQYMPQADQHWRYTVLSLTNFEILWPDSFLWNSGTFRSASTLCVCVATPPVFTAFIF